MTDPAINLSFACALDPASFHDMPRSPFEVVNHSYEGRYRQEISGWRRSVAQILVAVLQTFHLKNCVQPVKAFFGEKLVHIYREKNSSTASIQDLLKEPALQSLASRYDIQNFSVLNWNPKTLTFDLQKQWVPHVKPEIHDVRTALGRFAWVVIPPTQSIGGQSKLTSLFYESSHCIVPLAPTVKHFKVEFNSDGWLQMSFPNSSKIIDIT